MRNRLALMYWCIVLHNRRDKFTFFSNRKFTVRFSRLSAPCYLTLLPLRAHSTSIAWNPGHTRGQAIYVAVVLIFRVGVKQAGQDSVGAVFLIGSGPKAPPMLE